MYRQGDPGFLGNLWGGIKGAVVGYVTGGYAGAVAGAVSGYAKAAASSSRPTVIASGEVYGPVHLPGGTTTSAYPGTYGGGALGAYPGGYPGFGSGYAQQPFGASRYGTADIAGGGWGGYARAPNRGRSRRRRVCYYE